MSPFRYVSAVLVALCLSWSSLAASYYVSPEGNDNNDGSMTRPWSTLARAVRTPGPGDTLYIRGTYREQLIVRRSGLPGVPITYTAWPGDSATLDGAGSDLTYNRANRYGMVQIDHASYICVRRLRITNSPFFGIALRVTHHIRISRNYINNTVFSGIIAWEESDSANPSAKEGHRCITVDSNEVILACNDGPQECISLWGADTFEVAWNHVHHGGPGSNGGEGIDVKCGSRNGSIHHNYVHHMNRQGIYVDACGMLTTNIDIYANIVHDCPYQDGIDIGSESGGTLQDLRIFNNVAWNNGCNGLRFAAWGNPVGPMRNIIVVNNTFVRNGGGTWGNRGGISIETADISTVVLRNNIVSNNVQFQIFVLPAASGNVTVDHNLIDGFRGTQGETRGASYVEGDPLFQDPAAGIFQLREGSPAVNKGSAMLAPTHDILGVARPQGSAVDIGAYEYVPSGSTIPEKQWLCPPLSRRVVFVNGHSVRIVHDLGVQSSDIQGRLAPAELPRRTSR